MQVALLEWVSAVSCANSRLLEMAMIFCVPNGGHRFKGEAGKMKSEGVRSGVPDLLLLFPRAGYHGLALELKNGVEKRPSEAQEAWLDWLESRGFYVGVGRTFEEAKGLLLSYFHLPPR